MRFPLAEFGPIRMEVGSPSDPSLMLIVRGMALQGLVCFDLDGVIADSRDAISYCINLALAEVGVTALPPDAVDRYIGPPLIDSFREMLLHAGLDPAMAGGCVTTYRRYYGAESLARTRAYPGIREVIEGLSGVTRLAVVTSKLEVFARPLLASLKVDQWFEAVFGPPPQADDEPKGATLARALEFMPPSDGLVVMVGDRSHDVVGALKNNVVPIGVLWGFGSRDELAGAGATLIAETPADLAHIIGSLLVTAEG